MEIIDLRHFTSADLRPLLEEEKEVWSELLSWDYGPSADMILRYVDARILPGYAAVQRGLLHGYSFFVYEGNKGVIGDLFVTGEKSVPHAENPTEVRLVTHVVETLQQSPGVHRVEAQLLVHESNALARPFLEEGFQRFPRLFMALPLANGLSLALGPNRDALPPEIEMRRWSDQDYQPAASLITACYRGHVDSEINDQYRSIQGASRFLNNIVRFPGCGTFDAGASFLALDRRARAPIGLILCSRVKHDVGHVTQVCVLPEYRGKSIGRMLLAATSQELKRRHFQLLSLTVTEANRRAVELYKNIGFSVERVFDAFVWEA
ncbi:MAG TPA: GNAT family N-acetyltransferase [Terriglobales bacterium]|nr:GNAT family N-acetyltransferase [Terriglobales bacterium]